MLFAAKLKQTNLASKSDIANFANKTDFIKKLKNLNKKILQIKQNMYLLKMNLKSKDIWLKSFYRSKLL